MMDPGEEEVEASGEQDVVVDATVESDAESPDENAESRDSEDSGDDVEPTKVAAPDPRDLRIRLLEKQLEESEARRRAVPQG